jgi:pyroglutamyl-peptidase
MGNILVTGFEPFGGDARNPSGDAALALHGALIAGHRVHGVVLPCVFATAPAALAAAVLATQPALVLCLGLAASRNGFHPERVAINLIDARIPDNAGAQPVDVPVQAGAAPAAFTTLPVKAMASALQAAGHAATVSYSAGSYVCNQVFFALMQLPVPRGGFLHLGGDLALDAVIAGTRVALKAALAEGPDLAVSAGRID